MNDKVIIALDVENKSQALALVDQLTPPIDFYKIGLEFYLSEGNGFIKELKERNLKVFLDLKLHDIPNTVSNAVRAIAKLKPDMITVHTLGGEKMLQAAVDAARNANPEIKVLGVTVLTSLDEAAVSQIGFEGNIKDLVFNLAKLAYVSGCDGVVCSGYDLPILRKQFSAPFLMVTPGIRLSDDKALDQRRIATPSMAIEQGADYLVVGRSITTAKQPSAALKQLF